MKFSVSCLLLALGTSDAFTGPSPSRSATSALDGLVPMTGGTGATEFFNDQPFADSDAAWSDANPVIQWGKATSNSPPPIAVKPESGVKSESSPGMFGLTGGIDGSSLLDNDAIFLETYNGQARRKASPPPPALKTKPSRAKGQAFSPPPLQTYPSTRKATPPPQALVTKKAPPPASTKNLVRMTGGVEASSILDKDEIDITSAFTDSYYDMQRFRNHKPVKEKVAPEAAAAPAPVNPTVQKAAAVRDPNPVFPHV